MSKTVRRDCAFFAIREWLLPTLTLRGSILLKLPRPASSCSTSGGASGGGDVDLSSDFETNPVSEMIVRPVRRFEIRLSEESRGGEGERLTSRLMRPAIRSATRLLKP